MSQFSFCTSLRPYWAAGLLFAAASAQAAPVTLDLPAQPLADSLRQVAEAAGLTLAADSALIGGRQAPALKGNLEPEDALARLLVGSGLTAKREQGVILVQRAPAPKPAETRSEAVEPTTLSAITVTAEKSGRSLLDTATSTVVFEQTDLERRAGLNSVREVMSSVPNITLVGTGNAPVVRGVDGTGAARGFDAAVAGTRTRINLQIDGRPSTFNEIVYGDSALWDVQQVEVLSGAQSTLQGRNAIAGTVAVKTNDPSFDRETALRIGGGNYDQRRVSGVVSGPISDSLAYRFVADGMEKSSWVKGLVSFPGVNDPGDIEALVLRGKLLFLPSSVPGLRTQLTLNHTEYTGLQVETVKRPFPDRVYGSSSSPIYEIKSDSAIADVSYVIAPSLNFEGLLSATDFRGERKTQPGSGNGPGKGQNYIVEPRLRYSGEGRRSAVAGLYLFKADEPGSSDFGNVEFSDRTQTAAVFGEATWPIAATVDLIAGARYEQEHRERNGGNPDPAVAIRVDLDETYRAFLPKLGIAWHPQDKTTLGLLVSRGYNGGGAGAAFDPEQGVTTNYQYDPEYVLTYELFGRQELADDRLQLSGNLFFSDYDDMQLKFDLTPENPADFLSVVDNAKKVRTWGAEASATWLLPRGFEVYANLGLLKTEITRYPGSGYQGNDLPQAAPVSGGGGVNWVRNGWDANLGARYSDAYYSDITNQARGKVDPYTVVNAQLGYSWRQFRIYGSATNLLDSDKALSIAPGTARRDQDGNPIGQDRDRDIANLLAPRTLWAGVQWSL